MDLNKLKVVQLKELLQKRQLPTSGSKVELIARLQKADRNWMSDIEVISAMQIQEKNEREEHTLARDLYNQHISGMRQNMCQ